MSRTISVALKNHLAGEALTLAVCVRLERRDGTVMGFTTHDRDLVISGVTYETLNAITSSAINALAGNGVDDIEIVGVLKSDRITEADIRAGRYDGAAVEMFQVNWADLTQGRMTPLTGIIGEIRTQDGTYTAVIPSLGQRLGQTIGDLCGPLCRVRRLGDSECGKNLTAFTHTGSVVSVTSNLDFIIGSLSGSPGTAGYFDYGSIEFTSGANVGLLREIKTHTVPGNHRLVLCEPFPYGIAPADTVEVIAGCDRLLETCRDKFSNVFRFRGEPHVPGEDKVREIGRATV